MKNVKRDKSEYLEIQDFKEISKGRYSVDFLAKTICEGYLMNITERYFFVMESDTWKFDGLDVDFLKNELIK